MRTHRTFVVGLLLVFDTVDSVRTSVARRSQLQGCSGCMKCCMADTSNESVCSGCCPRVMASAAAAKQRCAASLACVRIKPCGKDSCQLQEVWQPSDCKSFVGCAQTGQRPLRYDDAQGCCSAIGYGWGYDGAGGFLTEKCIENALKARCAAKKREQYKNCRCACKTCKKKFMDRNALKARCGAKMDKWMRCRFTCKACKKKVVGRPNIKRVKCKRIRLEPVRDKPLTIGEHPCSRCSY